MNIEIAGFGKMSQSGSSLLGIIQNNDLPVLDLFVREAVQNSLDAVSHESKKSSVLVDIGFRDVNVEKLAPHFDGISEELIKRFGSTSQKMIYIEDKYTVGLTGPRNYTEASVDDAGNIFKLIYGVSMAQDQEGSGGSWGLGKTIYFRLGIGLVIYYSRIQLECGSYENRLAATLVEDETLDTTIIPQDNKWSRGIAWWGEQITGDVTIPINNDNEIQQILAALSTEMYQGTETGTKIIIPFIREQDLGFKTDLEDEQNLYENWQPSEYLKLALQRWYAPRLDNQNYLQGKWLDGRVNGNRILKAEMIPFFFEMQLLYNAAAETEEQEIEDVFKCIDCEVQSIELHRTFDRTKVGQVAFKKFSRADLRMNEPDNQPSPFLLIGKQALGDGANSPIILYTRKPGMIVNYEMTGDWSQGINYTTDDMFIIGIFVPKKHIKFKKAIGTIQDLEGYLRKSEKADHTSWLDLFVKNQRITVISRIQKGVRQAIAKAYEPKEKVHVKNDNNILARRFGKMLLPQNGYGQRATGTGGSPGSTGNTSTKSGATLKILEQKFLPNQTIQVDFELLLDEKVEKALMELELVSEGGKVGPKDWEKADAIGTPFPVEIINCTFLEIVTECESVPVEFVESDLKINYGMRIEKSNKSLRANGNLILEINDPFVQFSLKIGGVNN